MQAIILAAGKSTRAYPLTLTRPKPLLKIANKTLLEHNLDNLNDIVDEVIIVIGYKKNLIKKHIGSKYKNLKVKYVVQKQQLGTGNALLMVEKHIKNNFISLYGDDVYSREDFENVIKNKYSILTAKVNNPELFGVIIEKNGILIDLIEKPQKFVSNLVNTGLYQLDKNIFQLLRSFKKSKRNEYELTDAIKIFSKNNKIHCVKSKQWLPIGYATDLLNADKILRKSAKIKDFCDTENPKDFLVNKNIVGKNSKIYGNAKNSSIGSNCVIKGNVEDSIIMDNSAIEKNSVIKNSVIGEKTHIDGKIYNSIIADNSKIINSIIKNSRIWPNKKISNKAVEHDVQ
ncbi:NTP transferase domain-containing protein [Candidatus Woesearchaeota archaeon]|nr:NTP transferase domain-containing protein [Candidatus Woesearchaeota archaeon]